MTPPRWAGKLNLLDRTLFDLIKKGHPQMSFLRLDIGGINPGAAAGL